jgi:ParB-like chromosome segregation protein Spo0J
MNIIKIKIEDLKTNSNNPRIIRDDKFKKLVKSIKDFPQMLEIRPVVVDKDMVVLGGNQRYKACVEAGLKEIPVIIADELTEEQKKQFIIKDNVGFGEWDWDLLTREWETEGLADWGLDVWQQAAELDYSLLDDTQVDGELQQMNNGVKKAIQIEFDINDFERAQELVAFFRARNEYIGRMIITYLSQEKERYV